MKAKRRKSANIAIEKAKLYEEQNRELEQANIKSERVTIHKNYESKRQAVEAISDVQELRRRNCEERRLLGFPCP